MNALAGNFEEYLKQFPAIEQYDCRVSGGEYARINIRFHPENERDGSPFLLKSKLENKAVYTGLADFVITGAGQGFDNAMRPETTNYGIILLGYNYDKLCRIADSVRLYLAQNQRVDKVSVKSTRTGWEGEKPEYEFVFNVYDRDRLRLHMADNSLFYQSVRNLAGIGGISMRIPTTDGGMPLVIQADDSVKAGLWDIMNEPVATAADAYVKLRAFSTIGKERTGSDILRYNQQYQVVVNYNFIGDFALGALVQERAIKQVKSRLPVGYSIKEASAGFWSDHIVGLAGSVLLTIGIIFFLCALLLNSLRQALMVVSMIPVSFIGVFLTVALFDFKFDEGGYASFIVLSGIVVNWALFILNDHNNLAMTRRFLGQPRKTYIKAFNLKIIPIALSASSSILGLLPFVVAGAQEPFWFALAICTIGGLLCSVLATLLLMPVFMRGWQQQGSPHKTGKKW